MAYLMLTSLAFCAGMVVNAISDWRIWLPLALVSGFAIGAAGSVMGLS